MLSWAFLWLLLGFPLCSCTKTSVDVNVYSGDTAFLPCPLLYNSSEFQRMSVQWVKDGDQRFCRYNIERSKAAFNITCSARFKVNTYPSGLNITAVEGNDDGIYTCVMIKLIPPPVEERSSTTRLNVISLTLQLMNSSDVSCVELLCSLKGMKPQQVNFTWIRAFQVLRHHSSSTLSSTLTLCKPNWTEGEKLTCNASYSQSPAVYSKSITLPQNSGKIWMLQVVISTCSGLLLFILLGVVWCIIKCKKKTAERGSITLRNKIYENFAVANNATNPPQGPRTPRPGVGQNTRSTTRSIPRIIRQTQTEESIYEN